VALAWRPAPDRGGAWGAAAWLAFLLPVLPLRNHTYHYYLYAPLAGAAAMAAGLVAAATDTAFARRGRRAVAWGVAGVAGMLVLNGALLVHKIETFPFGDPALRADATVDRALIARRVADGLAAADLPRGTRLVFWSPIARARHQEAGRDPAAESYWERNVRSALLDGVAVRVLFPQVDSVRFEKDWRPDPGARVALYDVDGRLRVVEAAEVDSVLRAGMGR
jgi:hypothetical protein